jgi:hypothetical protein
MSILEDREKAAERLFVQENDLAFRIVAHRNNLLGRWAAGHMGLVGADAKRYAMSIVDAQVIAPGDAAIIKKVCADLVAHGVVTSEKDIRRQLQEFARKAYLDLMPGTGTST